MLLTGVGCPKDVSRGKALLKKCANNGDSVAQRLLGEAAQATASSDEQECGCGGVLDAELVDPITALTALAEGGDVKAMKVVGGMLTQGVMCTMDKALGFHWLHKAALHGDAEAMCVVGVALIGAKGCTRDLLQAFKWMERSAELGDKEALHNCGLMLIKGLGCTQDVPRGTDMLRQSAQAADTEDECS